MSIPKLDLLACCIAQPINEKVLMHLQGIVKNYKSMCWSDSLDGIHWIKGLDKKWPPFVQRRVEKIWVCVRPEQWRHIPRKINPTDLPPYGSTKMDNIISILSVPAFLYDENDWSPDRSLNDISENRRFVEPSKTDVCVLHSNVKNIGNIVNIKLYAYSYIWKLCRITSYVIRFSVTLKNYCLKVPRLVVH